jgi:hypothetical protein
MNAKSIRAAVQGLAAFALASQLHARELELPREGWVSWQVEAVEGAPDWCCWSSWDDRAGSRQACRLDEERGNFGSRDHSTTDAMRVYAHVAGGKVERLRVLSATCPVETATPVRVIDATTDDSARWFIALSGEHAGSAKHDDFEENVLAGLAMHRGDLAHARLAAIARGEGGVETRKKAVFWLALLRGVAGADVASSVMFNDQDAEMRKHAAFAATLTKLPRMAKDLIRLGNADPDGEVRAQAWFWLAHTGAAESEAAITAALRNDRDESVREQAVFALSQLPDERATRALIAAAQDRSLSNEQRKRAVFWLAQSESTVAQAYLDKVLAGTGSD